MKHRVYGKHLGRDKNQRTTLFKSLVGALILQGSIVTTEAKAKAVKGLVDKIITQAKNPSAGRAGKNTQRLVSQFLTQKLVQEKLFKEVIPAVKERNSGYTSVVKLGNRVGDNAMKVRMSLLISEKPPRASLAKGGGKVISEKSEAKKNEKMKSGVASKTTTRKVVKK